MDQFEDDLVLQQQQTPKLKKPKMYRVLLHNNHYISRYVVVLILQEVFRKSQTQCTQIMLEAHTKGIAVVGIYTHEIAQHSIEKVEELAEIWGSFLECTMEEVEL